MGNILSSMYIDEPSEDSSDSDFDYTPEPRIATSPKVLNMGTKADVETLDSALNFPPDEDIKNEAAHNVNRELDLTTDAAMNADFPTPKSVLKLDQVLQIENKLEPYEMVSLVYLLYDDAHYALQELIMLLKGAQKNLLYSWANVEENRCDNWQRRLIEALCIIKNYEVLNELGYNKQDLIVHFMPHRATAVTSINRTRKAIYLVCEKLNISKTDTFLGQVKIDFQDKNLDFVEYDTEFLELYFLKWETMRYISMTDLSNVKKVLKAMDEEHLYDILNDVVPQAQPRAKEVVGCSPGATEQGCISKQPVSKTFEGHKAEAQNSPKTRKLSTSTDTHQLQSGHSREAFNVSPVPSRSILLLQDNLRTASSGDDDNYRYKINPENPGVVLIINQKYFYTELDEQYKDLLPKEIDKNKLEKREGTEKDREALENIFKRFGFKVFVKKNLTHEDLLAEIKTVVKGIKEESSLFVCIMSHGDKGVVYGSNSCEVKISKIQEIMCRANKEHLKNKPKILILQSCQGKQCQKIEEDSEEEYALTTDGPSSSKQTVPRTADMLTFWATVPGYAAIRNKRTGSWFIQALCSKMEDLGNRHHFADICTRIVHDVTGRTWTVQNCNKNSMTPLIESTLRADFYLPPMRDL